MMEATKTKTMNQGDVALLCNGGRHSPRFGGAACGRSGLGCEHCLVSEGSEPAEGAEGKQLYAEDL